VWCQSGRGGGLKRAARLLRGGYTRGVANSETSEAPSVTERVCESVVCDSVVCVESTGSVVSEACQVLKGCIGRASNMCDQSVVQGGSGLVAETIPTKIDVGWRGGDIKANIRSVRRSEEEFYSKKDVYADPGRMARRNRVGMEGPGEVLTQDRSTRSWVDLVTRVKDGLPEMLEANSSGGKTSVSSEWFRGMMTEQWFEEKLLLVDHEDDRSRRDWSKKKSELKKGKNRYDWMWEEWMKGVPYSQVERYPYNPACQFGQNISSDTEIEEQRDRALRYCELLRSYVSWWTKAEERHPIALVGFSGAGLMVRGFLWMGIRCVMVDIEEQPSAPIGEDCIFIKHDVLKMDMSMMEVDIIQMSPPCPPASTAPHLGGAPAKGKQLIPEVRQMLEELKTKREEQELEEMVYSMENVNSSGDVLQADLRLEGQTVGARVNRTRLFETNFSSDCDLTHQLRLCQGSRRKFPKNDKSKWQ
jgi:hypothetical protein